MNTRGELFIAVLFFLATILIALVFLPGSLFPGTYTSGGDGEQASPSHSPPRIPSSMFGWSVYYDDVLLGTSRYTHEINDTGFCFENANLSLRYPCLSDAVAVLNESLNNIGYYMDNTSYTSWYVEIYLHNGTRRTLVDYIYVLRGKALSEEGAGPRFIVGIDALTGRYVEVQIDAWALGITRGSDARNPAVVVEKLERFLGYKLDTYGELRLVSREYTVSRYTYRYTIYVDGRQVVYPTNQLLLLEPKPVHLYINIYLKGGKPTNVYFKATLLPPRNATIYSYTRCGRGFNVKQYVLSILAQNNITLSNATVYPHGANKTYIVEITKEGPVYVAGLLYTVNVYIEGYRHTIYIAYDCVHNKPFAYRAALIP